MGRTADTRERLQREALRLFSERGFDDVTVEEVARAAGVSHMTFFRHFPTKESVVMDDPYDPLLAEAIALQDPTLSAIERVRRGVLQAWQSIDDPGDRLARTRVELAAAHSGLRARVWENNRRTEEVIVKALTETGTDLFEASVAAGAALGALTAALFGWAEQGGSTLGDLVRAAMGLLAVEPVKA